MSMLKFMGNVEDETARIRWLREMDKSNLPPDGGPQFNRLIFTSSPYLLQHAENPVDWRPWGSEAFDEAREEDKPIFLSIGYATCHWCHVMAHESFEDKEVAEVINRYFIPIKVDREERPDVDEQYMTAAHLMNVSGGWPLTVVMSPDRRPFFIATYLSRTPRQGMAGIIDLLRRIAGIWTTNRAEIEKQGAAVTAALAKLSAPATMDLPGEEVFEKAYRQLRSIYDKTWGGFGTAPKFPMPLYLAFLLRYARRKADQEALGMADHTLRMMRRGGICDQIGYGFHRYSVDREWLVPHFEKMLYDQALLAMTYIDAFQAMKDEFFRKSAGEIFAYVRREMTSGTGGFYSALDADSEGGEGNYYLWTPAQVEAALGPEPARRFCRFFGITEEGNFEGKNILHLPLSLNEFAEEEGKSAGERLAEVEYLAGLLLREREKRPRPLTDEKILTAWNGLMIAALARGYAATGDDEYRLTAIRAISFIRDNMTNAAGRLLRIRHAGQGGIPGFLEDYAFFCWGLIEIYQATLEPDYLALALHYTGDMLRLFRDPEGEGFFESGRDVEPVLISSRGGNDGVTPSGNSAAAMNLLRLGRITQDNTLFAEGEAALRSSMGNAVRQPTGYLALLSALHCLNSPPVEVTLAGDSQAPDTRAMLHVLGRRLIPGLVLRHAVNPSENPAIGGKTTAYLCAGGACRPPTTEAVELEKLLDETENNPEVLK